MTEKEFIEYIGSKATLDYQQSGILASITIAQACLEAGYGTTDLAINANNLFGMKTTLSGNTWKSAWDGKSKYTKKTKEEYKPGIITTIIANFRKYPSIDKSIEDHSLYLSQAKNGSKLRYPGLVEEQNYKTAIQIIKNGGYATDNSYVQKICSLIEKWNLTKYDIKGDINMEYTNSSLVTYTKLSPNHSGARTHTIDRITPHCVVGQLSASGIAGCFTNPGVQASCNYGIGTEGGVALIVEEKNRSWCSSSNANDQRAVTIECACDSSQPYTFNSTVYNKLVELCVDICRRNGKNKLLWISNKEKALNYTPASNEMLLTVHRWFANKSCPGDWMYSRMGELAEKVTKKLKKSTVSSSTPKHTASNSTYPKAPFAVQITGAMKYFDSKGKNRKELGEIKKGTYTIVETSGKWGKLLSGAGWIYLKNANCTVGDTTSTTSANKRYKVQVTTSNLNIRKGAGTSYPVVGHITDKGTYTIVETSGKWGKLLSGAGWIYLSYTKKL